MASLLERGAGLSGAVSSTRPVWPVKVLEGLSAALNQNQRGPDLDAAEGLAQTRMLLCVFQWHLGVSGGTHESSSHVVSGHQVCIPPHTSPGPSSADRASRGLVTTHWPGHVPLVSFLGF